MANEYLKRKPTSTGNRKVFTWSGWIKLNEPSVSGTNGDRCLFSATDPVTNGDDDDFRIVRSGVANGPQSFYWNSSEYNVGGEETIYTNTVVRDVSSWQHVILVKDSTQTTSQDRVKIYVNGVKQQISEANAVTQNADRGINSLIEHNIGEHVGQNRHFHGEMSDIFFVDGQALTPDVFGFYKQGKGYISAGSTQSTDFRPGQWVPKTPRVIKTEINRRGGFGVNGFYLPMNDSSNFGADFHCEPNSIITLKGEDLPQPRNGAPTTTDAYVSQLRSDPYAANLVLAVPGISTSTSANIITNGNFDSNISGWTTVQATTSWQSGVLRIIPNASVNGGVYQSITTEVGKRYTVSIEVVAAAAANARLHIGTSTDINSADKYTYTSGHLNNIGVGKYTISFTPSTTTTIIWLEVGGGTQTQIDFDNIVVKQEDAPRDYSADIKGSGTNKTLTANGNAGVGYEIPSYYGSAMSFDGTGDYFSVPNTSDFRFTSEDFTIEAWIKTNNVTDDQFIFGNWNATDNRRAYLLWIEQGTPRYNAGTDGTNSDNGNIDPGNALVVYNDEWAHVAMSKEGSTNRVFLNGVCVGVSTTGTDIYDNTVDTPLIGGEGGSGTREFNGYIQDLRVYKGVAKYKGGFDVPKPYTPVGIATWRAVPDCTANNFATLNPLHRGEYNARTLTNGNLTISHSSDDEMVATVGITTGKWYWETLPSTISSTNNYYGIVGAGATSLRTLSYYYRSGSGTIVRRINNVSTNLQSSLTNASANDVIGIAFNASDKELSWYLNGTQLGTTVTSIASTSIGTSEYFPFVANQNTSVTKVNNLNFGQNPTFSGNTTAGTFTDSNGKGLFKYQPPTGFLALCEDNLPTPAIADPGKYFKTVLYTGTGNSNNITSVGFKPDFIWIKERTSTSSNQLMDSVRGLDYVLYSNATNTEFSRITQAGSTFSSTDSGFSIGTNDTGVNESGQNYVAWCWRAGAGTTSTNTDGSITSVVSVNQDAGFSIVSYTGNSTSGATVGHELGKAPSMVIIKARDAARGWNVYHQSLGNTKYIQLSSTAAAVTNSAWWNNTSPNSSTFTLGNDNDVNGSGIGRYIAYCWAEIEGFSKFGIYSTNSSTDGPFVYLGFKPAFLLVKPTYVSNWIIMDSSRGPVNPDLGWLYPDGNFIEDKGSSRYCDFLSNGFKVRNGGTGMNNGGSVIFAAFAESPFTTANAK